MTRTLKGAIALLALCAAAPAIAADYPELRSAYPNDWASEEGSLRFETGLRYWYSIGSQEAGFGPTTLSVNDRSHILEVHGKIDDLYTQSYVKANAGLSVSTSGDFTLSPGNSTAIGQSSRIGYVGADFGWLPFGNATEGVAVGGLVGYQYWNDSPDIGRGNFITGAPGAPTTGVDSSPDNLDIHALRIGVRGTAEINDMFDVQAEVAGIPYAHVTGVLGPHELNGVPLGGGNTLYKASQTNLSGTGYGAMGELMVGFHPTENLTLRVGGRAWYVEGALDAKFDGYTVDGAGNVSGKQGFIMASDYARIFRYGAMFELTGRF
ncbi:hypothetical protein WH87_06495 [Devosia epidermidihirudinis]|uniref:Porin n=1 Tax=Devosia epidermidihirudinis TaxID=1293439 RepID=A0A0F5QGA7_9HYPH|nr:hypothetical protein [Devosia epidermidihirudinis]KKC39776.1 hypothetical protein WH87_06495 [Devosia epidermidihirudinis]